MSTGGPPVPTGWAAAGGAPHLPVQRTGRRGRRSRRGQQLLRPLGVRSRMHRCWSATQTPAMGRMTARS